jgi:hypothetical protein
MQFAEAVIVASEEQAAVHISVTALSVAPVLDAAVYVGF